MDPTVVNKTQISNGCRARIQMGSLFQNNVRHNCDISLGRTPTMGTRIFFPINWASRNFYVEVEMNVNKTKTKVVLSPLKRKSKHI